MTEFELFQSALEIDDLAARQQFLETSCGGDAALRSRVEALVTSHESQSRFLNVPVVEQLADVADSGKAGTIVAGEGSTQDEDPDVTAVHVQGSALMNPYSDDEIPLGYLEPPTRPDSLGRLGHYEVLEVVGRGAFGTVLRAFDDKLHRVVAIKVMAPELATTSPARKRFLREAQASAAIRHEHVVSIYAVEEKPLPYLVMEYIPGQTLQQRLEDRGPLDLQSVLRLGRQIAEGLAAAHAINLIHRDIKPGNILLETGVQERVKITDFGLARTADDASLTQSGTIAGTPMYMAPEQALGKKLDQRADLFSFGSVLYQMVSGRPPFRAASALAVLKRVAEESPRPISEIIPETPQWLCDIIAKLHAKNPDERYQTAQEVAEVLADCEAQLKANAELQNFSRIPQAKPAASSKRHWLTAGGIVTAMLLLGVIVITLTNRDGKQTRIEVPEGASVHVDPGTDGRVEITAVDASVPPASAAPDPTAGEWVSLFNGKDLTGWKTHPSQPGNWSVKDGVLIGSERRSLLFTERGDYANFHLRAEAKINSGGDSGIHFRTKFASIPEESASAAGPAVGYEVELQKNRKYGRKTGTVEVVLSNAAPRVLGLMANDSHVQPDEWFTLEIIADHNRFITLVNGQELVNCHDPLESASSGHIALQVWSPETRVQFRKIEIKERPASKTSPPATTKRQFASEEWIDVIPLIDPEADRWHIPQRTGKNVWRIESGELVVGEDALASKLVLPLDSDWPAFECELEFTRRAGDSGFNLDLPSKVGECPLVFDPPGHGGVWLGSRPRGVPLKDGPQIVTGQRATIRVEVRRPENADQISVALNDAKIGNWRGDRNAIANTYKEGFPHDRRVALWIHPGGNKFVFHRIRIRMLDGATAESLRPVPVADSLTRGTEGP